MVYYVQTVGDSHADRTFKNIVIENVFIGRREIGPITMHRVQRDRMNFKQYIPDHVDMAIFCMGEIDIRCHIHRQITEQNRTLEAIVADLVPNFVKHIASLDIKAKKIILLPVPPADIHTIQWHGWKYPLQGSNDERVQYHNAVCVSLITECEKNGILCLDPRKHYMDANGMLITSLSDGNVHIGNTEFIGRLLEDLIRNT